MYEQYIANLKATREAKSKRMKELHAKAMGEGRTMDTGEAEEFETLESDIKGIDADLIRTEKLKALEDAEKASATPVDDTIKRKAVASHTGVQTMAVRKVEKADPGIQLARYVMSIVHSKNDKNMAFELAKRYFPDSDDVVKTLKARAEGFDFEGAIRQKANIGAAATSDSSWAGVLATAQTFTGDFIEYLRPRTLIGQAQFRPTPFNVKIHGQNGATTSYWVGQGKAKPVSKASFNNYDVVFSKVAGITTITKEQARFGDPVAEARIRNDIGDSVIERIDADLFDPDVAAVSGVNPAGLLNGVSPIASPANSSVDNIRAALMALWAPWDSTNLGTRPAYYTTPAVARLLAFKVDALGNAAFPGVTASGGTLLGVPLRVSQYLAHNGGSGGAPLILADESEIYLADDGSVTVDASDQVTIEMSNTPAGDAVNPTASSVALVSMWQTNSIAFRAERFIWWGKRRTGAVQWIDGFPTA